MKSKVDNKVVDSKTISCMWSVLIRGGGEKREPLDLKPSKILILISYTSSIMTICFPLGLI